MISLPTGTAVGESEVSQVCQILKLVVENAPEVSRRMEMNNSARMAKRQVPKISVIILSYNFEKYLKECVDSVLAQTLRPFEIIICDDYSSDESWAIISEYAERFPKFIKSYRHETNIGMPRNVNFAIKRAEGDLITFLDGDDRWLPRKLELEWKALQINPDARIAYSNVYTIDDKGNRTGIWYDREGHPPPSGDVFVEVFSKSITFKSVSVYQNEMIYRTVIDELGYVDKDVEIFLDWDWMIRSTARYPVAYSGEALIEYRIHDQGFHNSITPECFVKDMLFVYTKNLPLLASRSEQEATQIKRCVEDVLVSFVTQLKQVCDERLELIQRLDSECKQYRQVCDERLVEMQKMAKSVESKSDFAGNIASILKSIFTSHMTFIDVGAHHGDFTASLIKTLPSAIGMLFEPTPVSYEKLKNRFKDNTAIQSFNYALSNEKGASDFYTANDSAKNSLLKFSSASQSSDKTSVKVETLDGLRERIGDSSKIDFIKIDTQGNDLKVLQGARKTIRDSLPVILIESIFIPLYEGQDSYYEIFNFMKTHGYHLAGIFNLHCTHEGLIAFADLLFLPTSIYSKLGTDWGQDDLFLCVDPTYLVEQNMILQTACEERLELINQLTKTAEERLRVIQILDAEVKKLSQQGQS